MLIEIPVTIVFDCESPGRVSSMEREAKIFTLRYDTTDTDVPAQWCSQYPPPKNAHWMTDADGVLFDLFTSAADKAIAARAEKDPETYCSDPAEGQALAEALNDERQASSQFGVGS